MKKFTKIMLSVAAVTAVSAAMAISAMAEDTVTGTYKAETGVVTLDGVVGSGDQQTLLVLTEDAATVTESIIAQIDQDAAISQFVLPANIESGTYYIRIGGTNGSIQTGTLTIGSEPGGEPGGEQGDTVTIFIGDVSANDLTLTDPAAAIQANDGTQLARYLAGFDKAVGKAGTEYKLADGKSYFIGDVSANDLSITNAADAIQANDGTQLARYLAGFDKAVGKAGTTIEVVVSE